MDQNFAKRCPIKIFEKVYQSRNPEFLAVHGLANDYTNMLRGFFKDKGLYFEFTG